MPQTDFERNSAVIIKNFLATAIVIDDQVYLGDPISSDQPTTGQSLASPRRQAGDGTPLSTGVDMAHSATLAPGALSHAPSDHKLNGKRLIDKFGEIGVVCSVIRPERAEMENLNTVLERFASVADVFVLDWVLHGDATGTKTKELIRSLVADLAKDGQGRFRLIVVYTGEPDLEQVAEDLEKDLTSIAGGAKRSGFSVDLAGTGTRIVVYGKQNSMRVAHAANRSIAPDQLPDTVVREFAEVARGLLPNAVMASITALRRNAHQLLTRFPSHLDPAFVTQSILICPERASEQLVSMIAVEVGSILEDAGIARLLEASSLKEWLNHRVEKDISAPPTGSNVTKDDFQKGFEHLIESGIGVTAMAVLAKDHGRFQQELGSKKKIVGSITSRLGNSEAERAGDPGLALLMSLRHKYDGAEPQLTLGTIISDRPAKPGDAALRRYWLCLQPLCDSVRLKEGRVFPFLPVAVSTTKPAEKSDEAIIIEVEGNVLYLQGKFNPYLIQMKKFDPVAGELVTVVEKNGERVFKSTDGEEFSWVAELKPAHAQRIAHRVGTEMSRVGLVESEWGRL